MGYLLKDNKIYEYSIKNTLSEVHQPDPLVRYHLQDWLHSEAVNAILGCDLGTTHLANQKIVVRADRNKENTVFGINSLSCSVWTLSEQYV